MIEKLQDIFRDVFDDETLIINQTTSATDIEDWDSLMHITLLEAIQDEFLITFELEEMIQIQTVEDIILAIQKKLEE